MSAPGLSAVRGAVCHLPAIPSQGWVYNRVMPRGSKRLRRPGVWDVQVSAGKDPVTGRRRRLTQRVHGSEKDADRALTALQHEADTGKHGGTLASVATVVERWWEIHGPDFSPTTARRYRQIIDQYLLPRWGSVRITELDISELSAWFRSLQRAGMPGRDGKRRPLAPASVRQVRAVFRRALEEAVHWGWIETNPVHRAAGVPVPKQRKEADDPSVIVGLIDLAAKRDPDLAVWVMVAATTGMRRSEMAGLLWRDVDLDQALVVVHRAIVQIGRELHLKGTKTHQVRKLRLDADTVGVLRAHRARADETGPLDDEALVWSSSPDGRDPVSPDAMTQAWRRLCRSQGVAGIRLHDLRHFMATQAILAGLNVALVSQRLGHANISTTLNIYTDFVEAADQDVADHIGSILRPRQDDDGAAA
jgi:integrase